jgi:hypothetical protein
MGWNTSSATHIYIFNVGRGFAAFLRTPLNQGFLVDMGNEGGEAGFSPATFIKKHFIPKLDKYKGKPIAQCVLSHPHSDHITECGELADGRNLATELITCPHDKNLADGTDSGEKLNWNRIKNREETAKIIETYKSLYKQRSLPLQTILFDNQKAAVPPNLEYGLYYVRPPKADKLHTNDNEYGNACSIVFYYRHGAHSILMPGDMTPQGMELLLRQAEGAERRYTRFNAAFTREHPEWHLKSLDQPSLQSVLKSEGLSILVAPHHGLESCYCPALFGAIKNGRPRLNVISEKMKKSETDGCVHNFYQSPEGASGLDIYCEGTLEKDRRSVSTKNGHHILIVLDGTGSPKVFLEKDAAALVAIADGTRAAAAAR